MELETCYRTWSSKIVLDLPASEATVCILTATLPLKASSTFTADCFESSPETGS
jgi:hypothetical protein